MYVLPTANNSSPYSLTLAFPLSSLTLPALHSMLIEMNGRRNKDVEKRERSTWVYKGQSYAIWECQDGMRRMPWVAHVGTGTPPDLFLIVTLLSFEPAESIAAAPRRARPPRFPLLEGDDASDGGGGNGCYRPLRMCTQRLLWGDSLVRSRKNSPTFYL